MDVIYVLREVGLPLFLGAMRLAASLLTENPRNSFTSAVEDPGVQKMQKEGLLSVVGVHPDIVLEIEPTADFITRSTLI